MGADISLRVEKKLSNDSELIRNTKVRGVTVTHDSDVKIFSDNMLLKVTAVISLWFLLERG